MSPMQEATRGTRSAIELFGKQHLRTTDHDSIAGAHPFTTNQPSPDGVGQTQSACLINLALPVLTYTHARSSCRTTADPGTATPWRITRTLMNPVTAAPGVISKAFFLKTEKYIALAVGARRRTPRNPPVPSGSRRSRKRGGLGWAARKGVHPRADPGGPAPTPARSAPSPWRANPLVQRAVSPARKQPRLRGLEQRPIALHRGLGGFQSARGGVLVIRERAWRAHTLWRKHRVQLRPIRSRAAMSPAVWGPARDHKLRPPPGAAWAAGSRSRSPR